MNDDSQFKKPRSIWWQDSSKLVKLMLVIGIAQIALYYISTSAATDELTIPVPQPDTLLYCQAAKQICNGHPYVFSPGNSPSTGTTSHLYPFVLAIPYALGAKGDALLTAGFFLNALFYLFFLVNWGIIANKICESPSSRLFACILMALSGQPAYVAMSQSDMGLFMAISSGAFAALLCKRTSLFCALLVISPWCRPEGVILSVLLPFFIIGKSFVTKEKPDRKIWGIVAIAIFSSAGIFIVI